MKCKVKTFLLVLFSKKSRKVKSTKSNKQLFESSLYQENLLSILKYTFMTQGFYKVHWFYQLNNAYGDSPFIITEIV